MSILLFSLLGAVVEYLVIKEAVGAALREQLSDLVRYGVRAALEDHAKRHGG